MVARIADVEQREEVRRLAGRGQHRGRAALHLADLRRHRIIRRILQAGVEVAGLRQIEQTAHLLAGRVLEGRRLDDRRGAGLAVARLVAALHARGIDRAH